MAQSDREARRGAPGSDQKLEELWEKVMALGAGTAFQLFFYRVEWELVVQARGCEIWEDYKRASR